MRGVLDVSQQMLDANLFLVSGTDARGHMDELSAQVSILVNLLLGEVSSRRKTNLICLLHAADHIDGHRVVTTQDLVDLDVVLLGVWTSRVPAYDLLLAVDATHHVEHLFVVDVVEEPDVGLVKVFLEGHSEAVGHFELALVTIEAEKGADDTLLGVLGYSVVVVDD